MKNKIAALLSFVFLFSCSPKHNFAGPGTIEEDNIAILKQEMSPSLLQQLEGRQILLEDRVIKTEEDAIQKAKQFFMEEYGQDFTPDKRIYLSHLVNGFWITRGMLPRGMTGGSLVSIVDAASGELFSTLIWK